MDVSGLFSDGDERGAKQAAAPPAPAGRDGHQDRPMHLQAVADAASKDDPDQARRLLRRIADEADAVAAEPRAAAMELDDDDEPVDLDSMSPVQRIQAMREGRLAFPDIGGENDGDHSLAADDVTDSNDNASADAEDGSTVNQGALSDFTDGLTGAEFLVVTVFCLRLSKRVPARRGSPSLRRLVRLPSRVWRYMCSVLEENIAAKPRPLIRELKSRLFRHRPNRPRQFRPLLTDRLFQ